MRIALKHPVQVGETTVQNVTLRRAKSRDMVRIAEHLPELVKLAVRDGEETEALALNGGAITAMIEIVSTLGDLDPDVAGELDFEDLAAIMEKASDFLSFGASRGEA